MGDHRQDRTAVIAARTLQIAINLFAIAIIALMLAGAYNTP